MCFSTVPRREAGKVGYFERRTRACATLLVQLGLVIAELLNLRDWAAVGELEQVCSDIFGQAKQVKDETIDIIQ